MQYHFNRRYSALFTLMILVTTFLISSCASSSERSSSHRKAKDQVASEVNSEEFSESYDAAPAMMRDQSMAKSAPAPMAMKRAGGMAKMSAMVASEPAASPQLQEPKVQQSRMVHYTGNIEQRSVEPKRVLDSAEVLVKSRGGYIENRSGFQLTLRVPVATFRPIFDALCSLATVLNTHIQASDITDAFQDADLRLRIAEQTRTRYRDLLKKADNEVEKLRLLQAIARLTQEIEQFNLQRTQLLNQAVYSTITMFVQEYAPSQEGHADEPAYQAFEWIKKLDPLGEFSEPRGKYQKVAIPQGFVELAKTKGKAMYRLASADGARIRVRKLCNEPRGSAQFWRSAVWHQQKATYAKADTMEIGDAKFVRLESHGVRPYIYWVGLQTIKNKMIVTEVYFPSSEEENKYREAMINVWNKKEGV